MKNKLKYLALLAIFVLALIPRLKLIGQVSKDVYAYERAISDLFTGINPYIWTLQTYSDPDDPNNHGYAYLPGLLYLYGGLYLVYLITNIPFEVLWKIPVLLADIGVGILLIKTLFKRDYLVLLAGLVIWFFNPYSYIRGGYTYSDPIPVFLMFLSLIFLEKEDDVASGAIYALSIVFKTFPIILFPIYIIKSKKRTLFLISGFLIFLVFSIPFMRSLNDLWTFLQGSLLVHADRFVQGRPFLFYISYFYKIEFFQTLPIEFYSIMSMFFGWVVIIFSYFKYKIKNIYILALLSFLNFYIFTPVLNRTYTLWFLPVLVIASYELFNKRKYLYYVVLSGYYFFYSWYLMQWKDGFHIWRP